MTLRYLLDTNALSEAVKPTPDAHVMQRLAAHHAEIATAAPVWNELLYGCYRLQESVRRRALERYLFGVLRPQLQARFPTTNVPPSGTPLSARGSSASGKRRRSWTVR